MIVLVHNILPPYRVSLFNAIDEECGGEFLVLLTRLNYPAQRLWSVHLDALRCRTELLDTRGFNAARHTFDISLGVSAALDRLGPDAVVVAGWDMTASWAALRWARRRRVPAYAWIESSASSGKIRGSISTRLRQTFLSQCRGALVPGAEAERFVSSLRPGIECTRVPNSVEASDLRQLPPPAGDGGLIFVGELSLRKGADLLLAACPELVETFSHVSILGDGPLRPEATRVAATVPSVRYLGFVEGAEMTAAMADAAVLALPSRRDPWPLVACEALVAGRPLALGTGVSSAVDLAEVAGDAVVVMSTPDADQLVDAARRARKAEVPERARASFTPQASAKAFVSALQR